MRRGLVTIGFLVVIVGVVALASGIVDRSFIFIFWGVVLVLAIIVERVRYKRIETKTPGPGWQRTTERFVDEETGATVTVYIKPETGERSYVRD